MGVLLKIDGRPEWRASALSVSEDSTPLDISDMTGGTGGLTFSIPESPTNRKLRHKPVRVENDARGSTEALITTYGGDGVNVSVTADTRLAALNVERTVPPFSGTLGDLITSHLESAGITSGYVITDDVATIPITIPGGVENLWERTKRICAATDTEMALVSSNIVLRKPRTISAQTYRDSQRAWTIDDGDLAQTVEVKFYNSAWVTNKIVYPSGGWTEDVQILSVDAGEVLETNLPINASLTDVQQPVCVSSVSREYAASSVYTVAGADGLIIPPAQWANLGGVVSVNIGKDSKSLDVKIIAPTEKKFSPYTLRMPTSTSDGYSSLRIVGTGVTYEEGVLTLNAQMDTVRAPKLVGVTVENNAIKSRSQAVLRGLRPAMRYAGPAKTLTVTTNGINRLGETHSYVYSTIEDWNTLYATKTIGNFNTLYDNDDIGDWNEFWGSRTIDTFENQAYGNIGGARLKNNGTMYRIRSNSTQDQFQYTAEADSTIKDHKAAWAGLKISDWNAFHAGETIADLKAAPLASPSTNL